MEIDLDGLKAKLIETKQEHVLAFWDELEDDEKDVFAKQLEKIDFVQIGDLYEKSKKDDEFNIEDISPIPYVNSSKMPDEEKKKYIKIGEEIIRNGELAVISMAGGQRNKTWLSWTKGNI